MPVAPRRALANGATIPEIGLGTWPMSDDEAERCVPEAIALGYRLIDTASAYRNETGVGRGIKASGVARDELFVTSKFSAEYHGVELVRDTFAASVGRLGLDYLDLLLIHWPNPWLDRYVEAWRGLGNLLEAGLVRAIGVSNFKPAHLERLLEEVGIVPDVNQIELNPHVTRAELRAYDESAGILTQSWGPLGRGKGLLDEPAIREVAAAIGRTPAQVVLRWHLDLGLVTVPKSSSPARMAENLDVFDFRLTSDQIDALSGLDRGEDTAVDSDTYGH